MRRPASWTFAAVALPVGMLVMLALALLGVVAGIWEGLMNVVAFLRFQAPRVLERAWTGTWQPPR